MGLKTQNLLLALKIVESKGSLYFVILLKDYLTSTMPYALQNGIIDYNPALDLQSAIKSPKKHYPALLLERLPELFEHINLYNQGKSKTADFLALKLNIYLFVRLSELRLACWNEVDLDCTMQIILNNREPLGAFVTPIIVPKLRFTEMISELLPIVC